MKMLTICIVTILILTIPLADTDTTKKIEVGAIELYHRNEKERTTIKNYLLGIIESDKRIINNNITITGNLQKAWDRAVIIQTYKMDTNTYLFISSTYAKFYNKFLVPEVRRTFEDTNLVPLITPNIDVSIWKVNEGELKKYVKELLGTQLTTLLSQELNNPYTELNVILLMTK